MMRAKQRLSIHQYWFVHSLITNHDGHAAMVAPLMNLDGIFIKFTIFV